MASNHPARYRKRPLVIEAMPFTKDTWPDLKKWLDEQSARYMFRISRDWMRLTLETLEGPMTAQAPVSGERDAEPGAWIVKGIKDEIYPVRGDIFMATYEPEPRYLSPVDGA